MWRTKLAPKHTLVILVCLVFLAPPSVVRAQIVLDGTEEIDFDRPEAWAMKYFGSLSLMTALAGPAAGEKGRIEIGFDAAWVPSLSEEERRVGFDGIKVEDLNRTSVFGRIRAALGLPTGMTLELGWTPPIDIDGIKPNVLAVALARPFVERQRWRLGWRAHGEYATFEGDITCDAGSVAAGDDPELNPFRCLEPSNDEMEIRNLRGELRFALLFPSHPTLELFADTALNYWEMEMQVDARYGVVEDFSRLVTDGTTWSGTLGLAHRGPRYRFGLEIFYSPLDVVREPGGGSQNDGFRRWSSRFDGRERARRGERAPPEEGSVSPWSGQAPRPVFVVLWCTGPDPSIDHLVRIRATRCGADGTSWETFDRSCAPRGGDGEANPDLLDRLHSDYGDGFVAPGVPLEGGKIWDEFTEFARDHLIVAADTAPFEAWAAHLAGRPTEGLSICGLTEVAALLLPGRLPSARRGWSPRSATPIRPRPSDLAIGPDDLREALGELVRRFLELGPDVLGVFAGCLNAAWRGLWVTDPLGAQRIENVASLVDRPSVWLDRERSPRSHSKGLRDGALSDLAEVETDLASLIEAFTPRWSVKATAWKGCESVSPTHEKPLPFAEEDLDTIDSLFREHLPSLFAEETGTTPESAYRAGQHEVAREIARTLGSSEDESKLLLVHAPTGTGKTLAYLLPVLLWARRHEVRVGVATYTRALQEQAMGSGAASRSPGAATSRGRAGLSDDDAEGPGELPVLARVAAARARCGGFRRRVARVHPAPDLRADR